MGVYKMKVINITTSLNIRSGPGTQYGIVGKRLPGATFISDKSTNVAGVDWYREQGTNRWTAERSGTARYLSILSTVSSSTSASSTANKSTPKPKKPVTNATPKKKNPPKKVVSDSDKDDDTKYGKIAGSGTNTKVRGTSGTYIYSKGGKDLNSDERLGIPSKSGSDAIQPDIDNDDYEVLKSANAGNIVHGGTTVPPGGYYKGAEKFFRINQPSNYPKLTKLTRDERNSGRYDDQEMHSGRLVNYNLTIDQSIIDTVERIKKNLNIPTAYTRNEINNYTHTKFNRFRMEFPDLYMRNTTAVIFFTRPDLNLFSSGITLRKEIKNDPRDAYIIMQNRNTGALLTANGGGLDEYEYHNFNPLLSNLAQSLEIQDDSVDTVDMGETFTGYKMQYSKHNIRSITAGQLSIKFKETFNLGVTNMHQLWVDYQSNVYKGVFTPKTEHIWAKELDYACNIYYFLLDQDGETIRFWSKYYGCYPVNVPKSSFSFDAGSQVSFPELSVTYNYIYKSDLSPRTLVEFNHDGGDNRQGYTYLPTYAGRVKGTDGEMKYGSKDHSGDTWVGVPYVQSIRYNSGIRGKSTSGKVLGLKLRYRQVPKS